MVNHLKRSFISNRYASGLGVVAIILPVCIALIFTAISYVMSNPEELEDYYGILSLQLPEDYDNMTYNERRVWYENLHGGAGGYDFWSWGGEDTGVGMSHHFADGVEVGWNELGKIYNGEAQKIDVGSVLYGFLTFDVPLLNNLGTIGLFIKIALIVSIILGMVELIWIG